MKKITRHFLKSIIFVVAITAMANMAAGQTLQNQTVCAGQTTTLTATGGTSYNWSTGDTTATTVVTPTSTTQYWVTVTQSGNTSLDSVTVTVNQNPIAGISGSNTMNYGSSDTLTASGGTSFLWNTGDTTASVIISPSNTTNYIVTVTNLGCTTETGVTVTVNNSPPPIQTKFKICNGQSVALTAPLGNSYIWSTGDSTQTAIVSPDSAKTYLVTVTLQDSTSVIDSFMVYIRPIPVVYAGNDTVSPGVGSPVTLTATDSTATNATFHWSYFSASGKKINIRPDNDIGSKVTVKPKITTTYFVTVKTKAGCTAAANVTVTVNDINSSSIFIGQDSVGHSTISTIPDSTLYIQSARTASTDTARNTIINSNNAGRVGIGTNNPTEKLSVTGNASFSGNIIFGGNQRISYTPSSGGGPDIVNFGNSMIIPPLHLPYCIAPNEPTQFDFLGSLHCWGNADWVSTGNINVLSVGYDGAGGFIDMAGLYSDGSPSKLSINYYCGHDVIIGGGGGSLPNTGTLTTLHSTYLAANDGNVGIGTSSPKDKLQIGDSYNKVTFGELGSNSDLGYSTSYLGFNAYRDNTFSLGTSWIFNKDGGGHNGGGVIMNVIAGNMMFIPIDGTNNGSYDNIIGESISSNGSNSFYNLRVMQINPVTHPGGTLTYGSVYINGKITAREVEITLDPTFWWSDYVFNKNYALLSISELEKYLKKNKHLPDVPSSKEVIKKGINVGEMDATLLKKIEELYLYVIDLKKQNDEMQKEINLLKNK